MIKRLTARPFCWFRFAEFALGTAIVLLAFLGLKDVVSWLAN